MHAYLFTHKWWYAVPLQWVAAQFKNWVGLNLHRQQKTSHVLAFPLCWTIVYDSFLLAQLLIIWRLSLEQSGT